MRKVSINTRIMQKFLKYKGYRISRYHGSHIIYKGKENDTLTFKKHKNSKTFSPHHLKDILKDMHSTLEELIIFLG